MHYPTAKEPIGEGHVFWSDEGKQIRVFGKTTSLRGPVAVLERVAMRILHLVDGHGPYGTEEADTECKRCEAVRAARRRAAAARASWSQGTRSREAPVGGCVLPDGFDGTLVDGAGSMPL